MKKFARSGSNVALIFDEEINFTKNICFVLYNISYIDLTNLQKNIYLTNSSFLFFDIFYSCNKIFIFCYATQNLIYLQLLICD